jgi:4-amino-4-deoxychorismate lyase
MLFFESIKILDGIICNPNLHLARINRTLKTYKPLHAQMESLTFEIPESYKSGLVKCKLTYDFKIQNIEFEHYQKKIITSYQIVRDDKMSYAFKFCDRSQIDFHKQQVGDTTEIIIVKNGLITDASYANICFWTGREWHTPKYPLLRGTKRTQLIAEKKIFEKNIMLEDLKNYSKLCFINAMIDIEAVTLPIY